MTVAANWSEIDLKYTLVIYFSQVGRTVRLKTSGS